MELNIMYRHITKDEKKRIKKELKKNNDELKNIQEDEGTALYNFLNAKKLEFPVREKTTEIKGEKYINEIIIKIAQTSLETQYFFCETIKNIEKKIDVLDIIKKKMVNMVILIQCETLENYNKNAYTLYNLTQEEFNLLKEVLAI